MTLVVGLQEPSGEWVNCNSTSYCGDKNLKVIIFMSKILLQPVFINP